jgi:hypothetical protein
MAKVSLDCQYFKFDKDGKPCYGKILRELANGCCSVVLYDDRDKNGSTFNFSFKREQLEDENCEVTPDRSSWYPELLEELRAKYLESFNILCEELRQNPDLPYLNEGCFIIYPGGKGSRGKKFNGFYRTIATLDYQYKEYLKGISVNDALELTISGYTNMDETDVEDAIDVNDVQALLEPFFEESLKAKVQEMCS